MAGRPARAFQPAVAVPDGAPPRSVSGTAWRNVRSSRRMKRRASAKSNTGLAPIAALIGDRARAAMLLELMAGRALTATELARAAGVSKQTASAHFAKLLRARLVAVEQAGRHRYVRLADRRVAGAIESLLGLARVTGSASGAPHPDDWALRKARTCYDHLAGDLGVLVYDSLVHRGLLDAGDGRVRLTTRGERFVADLGVDVASLRRRRRPLCLACLDWTVRRHHLAGALGAALLSRFLELGWARRVRGSRVLSVPATGERALRARFPSAASP